MRDDGRLFEELLQAMLAAATDRIRIRGFERGYASRDAVGSQPTGRLLFADSIATCTFATGRLAYRHDEFGADTPNNRVLKACARILAGSNPAGQHQESLRASVREMRDVADVPLSPALLRSLPRSIASRRYRVVRFVARLLVESGQPDERIGEEWARRLIQDKVRMRRLFERFVYRFTRNCRPKGSQVGRDRHEWSGTRQEFVPRLETDVTIRWKDRIRIIECKYTPNMFADGPNGALMYRPEHLRQIFSYLARASASGAVGICADGVLLYPALDQPSEARIELGDFPCTVARLGLAQPWPDLASQLRSIAFD
jgi:5-methylcytosine-specific restriction endonuclease McrBC regulatory subunit McrC